MNCQETRESNLNDKIAIDRLHCWMISASGIGHIQILACIDA